MPQEVLSGRAIFDNELFFLFQVVRHSPLFIIGDIYARVAQAAKDHIPGLPGAFLTGAKSY